MSGVNQFRQLFVVKKVDDDNTYLIDKTVNATNFGDKKSSLYVYDESSQNYNAVGSSDEFVKSTKYYVKDTSRGENDGRIANEEGEIEVNKDNEGNLYFSYGGQGSTKANPSPLRSDLIEPSQIVDARITKPVALNKGKLIQTTKFEVNPTFFATGGDGEKLSGVTFTINFYNFGNGVNAIYPFTVYVKKFVPTDATDMANHVKEAFDNAIINDLAGNRLVVASVDSTSVTGKSFVVITSTPTGDYVPGKTSVYYPRFDISVSADNDKFIDSDINVTYAPATGSNYDVASEMELAYAGSRFNGGQTLPYNFPYNGNFKQMVEVGANYSSIDIHYYKTNEPDFSQKSHGTITLLIKESDNNSAGNALAIAGKIVKIVKGDSATVSLSGDSAKFI